MGDDEPVISHRIQGVTFSLFSSKEIKKLSVKELTNPNSFDILNHPTTGGLYDPALGAIENQNLCETCGQAHTFCPGHMGHITLPLPVYSPFLFRLLYQLLQCACFQCHHLLAKPGQMCVFRKQMEALEHGHVSIVESMKDAYNALVVERGGDQGILEELEKLLSERIDQSECSNTTQQDGQKEHFSNKKLNTKNVFALRQEMVKDFLRSKGFRGKSCPHCGTGPRQLRTEHNNKVFFATKKTVVHRKQTLQQQREAELRKQAVAPEDIDALDNDSAGSDDDGGELKSFNQAPQDYLTPMETRNHMRALWKNEATSLAVVLGALGMKMKGTKCPLDVFFLDVLPVPPLRFRPLINMRDRVFENQQTANYSRVISDSIIVRELLTEISKRQEKDQSETIETEEISTTVKNVPGSTLEEKLHNTWLHLQTKVNCVLDSDLDKLSTDRQPGIKQLLEKKEGLFRKHMMGKRVDYAARSVISPDPYINTDEIGVPLVFATKLTYPQPVTPWNFHELKQAIINGPDVHPGACYVENEHGRKIRLHAQDRNQREAIAKQLLTPSAGTTAMSPNKKVYRHLKNGDVMLLNRQPTLHRPSIQAHKVRVLPGEKTLRLHYANCKAYNADFDGDEMNAHFPQDELCRSESYHLASTHYQYLVPKDGTPLAGLIQDHMVSGVSLTMRGRHFTRGDYQQLVFAALTDRRGPVKQLPPCLLKPERLWSGKQVLSTVLLNIIPPDKPPLNLKGKTKLSGKNWQSAKPRPLVEMLGIHGDSMGESEVIIRQGELLVGVLDKGHYGNTPYGLVHCCYELYGGDVAGRLLTSLAKLFTAFLQWRGFTLGVEDINVTSKADSKRHKLIKKGRKGGAEEAATALGLDKGFDPTTLFERLQQAHFSRDDGEMKDLDLAIKAKTDQINNDICQVLMPQGLEKKFPHNNLQLMVQSGAKGSSVNCMQISCLLGQIELEGRRPPLMMSGQFLPSFLPYNTSPRAGGFVDQRFLTGIRPQEYFFHCMAGREGLVDTAVKTSRSGYLQRCLIKHMEGLIVNYDLTVRDSDGSIVQFRYGDDGLDVMKTQFLRKQQFPFLIDNKEAVMSEDHLQSVKSKLDTSQAPKLWKKMKKWRKKTKGQTSKIKGSPFHKFVKKNSAKLLALLPEEAKEGLHEATGRAIAVEKLCEVWGNMDENHRSKYSKYLGQFPDPVLTQLQPDRYFGAVSEKFEDIVDQYFKTNPDGLLVERRQSQPGPGQIAADKFRDLLYMSSMQSLAPPGEAVGLLAAQSIGEPSTQMTLNTFHFAGRGEMNVTLGIPRLREILMVASANIRTPTMDIPLLDTRYAEDHAQDLKNKLNKIHLSQVLEEAEVRETLTVKNLRNKSRAYTIKFKFLPPDVYSSEITVAPSSILRYMEHKFLKQFATAIRKRMEELQKCRLLSSARRKDRPVPGAGPGQATQASNDNDILDDDQNEDDSVAVRNRQKQLDEQDYEGEDEEKEELGEESESDEAYSSESETEQLGSFEQSESSLGSMQEALDMEGGSQTGSSQGQEKTKRKKKEKKEMDARRVNAVLSSANSIQSYEYDATKERWCKVTYQYPLSHSKLDMATLLESEAKKAVLYQTPKISRSFLSQSKKPGEEGLMRLKTEGINIQEMFKYERILDLNKLYTNDIHATAEFYGIEAACQVLIKEVRDVFAAYGIQVDYRHLSLVADYMTFEGVYKAFNRIGLETNASPLQKMTFETTMHFLRNATTMGVCDDLKSPSARLVVGRTALSGTGSFDILQPLS